MKTRIILWLMLVLVAVIASCQSEEQLEFSRYYSSGSLTYQNKCQNCHGKNGEGLGGLIPGLTDTAFLKANKKFLGCVIKYGLADSINVNNKTFAENMPPQLLSSVEIAGVLTFVTNSFGNKMGIANTQLVEKDLQSCR